jgi:hypothetical protein
MQPAQDRPKGDIQQTGDLFDHQPPIPKPGCAMRLLIKTTPAPKLLHRATCQALDGVIQAARPLTG